MGVLDLDVDREGSCSLSPSGSKMSSGPSVTVGVQIEGGLQRCRGGFESSLLGYTRERCQLWRLAGDIDAGGPP